MTKTLRTPVGDIEYEFTRKRVKRINLRVRNDGTVAVSAPRWAGTAEVERFVASKTDWILETRAAVQARAQQPQPEAPPRDECLALFTAISDEIFPLFADVLGGKKPAIKVRSMKTRWGTCNRRTNTITLNSQLAAKPLAAAEYVVLHEYVHFIHPDHQAGFHAEMARLMPDYKERRKLLR